MLASLPNAYGDAATNMAIDSALTETVPSGTAALRHYGWSEPSITFGYSQCYREVAAKAAADGITLCRRSSGGGIVDHRNDWTYACIIHRQAPCAQIPATELYATVHKAMASALDSLGQSTTLAPCPRQCDAQTPPTTGPDQCFIRPVMNDLLNPEGRKIAGAAMKRSRRAVLIQGSLDRESLPPEFNFTVFSEAFVRQLAEALHLQIALPDDLRPYFDSQKIQREKEKFAGVEWTQRR